MVTTTSSVLPRNGSSSGLTRGTRSQGIFSSTGKMVNEVLSLTRMNFWGIIASFSRSVTSAMVNSRSPLGLMVTLPVGLTVATMFSPDSLVYQSSTSVHGTLAKLTLTVFSFTGGTAGFWSACLASVCFLSSTFLSSGRGRLAVAVGGWPATGCQTGIGIVLGGSANAQVAGPPMPAAAASTAGNQRRSLQSGTEPIRVP